MNLKTCFSKMLPRSAQLMLTNHEHSITDASDTDYRKNDSMYGYACFTHTLFGNFLYRQWTVSQLSIMIIYNCTLLILIQ